MHYVSKITFIGMCWNGIIKTLINLVQKFIVRSFWNNAAVQIRKPGFYSQEDSLQPFCYQATHKWAPLQTEVKRIAQDSSLGAFNYK